MNLEFPNKNNGFSTKKETNEVPNTFRSNFLKKVFWVDSVNHEIIQVRNLDSNIIRKIGDSVISNGKIFKEKGIKGTIIGFQEDTCYMKIKWEDGDISDMKDGDLILFDENKLALMKKGVEIFDIAYKIAISKNDQRQANQIVKFRSEAMNVDVNEIDLEYTIGECLKYINKNKK